MIINLQAGSRFMVSSFYLPPMTAEVNLDLSREVSTRWLRTSVAKSEELRSSCTSRTMRICFAHLIISREANCSRTAKCADTWEEVSSKHRIGLKLIFQDGGSRTYTHASARILHHVRAAHNYEKGQLQHTCPDKKIIRLLDNRRKGL